MVSESRSLRLENSCGTNGMARFLGNLERNLAQFESILVEHISTYAILPNKAGTEKDIVLLSSVLIQCIYPY